MITNGDMTLFIRSYDKETRTDQWQPVFIKGVLWEDNQKSDVVKGGMEKSDSVTIFIPFSMAEKGVVFAIGDKVAKGLVTSMDACKTITGIESFDYGSSDMQHWEVYAQ